MEDWLYTLGEVTVAIVSVLGNSLVIYVFLAYNRLRSFRNYYIFGLAVADFLIGLVGIPLSILVRHELPSDLNSCLFTCSSIVIFCAVGIFCLVGVSVDRFWAVWDPVGYYKIMGLKAVMATLFICTTLGILAGMLPLFGWYNKEADELWAGKCMFTLVMDYDYLVFVYFGVIIIPALLMASFYGYIYHFISQRRKKKPHHPRPEIHPDPSTQERATEHTKNKEAKAGKKLSTIILFFVVCWMPLNTINCVVAFCGFSCAPPIWFIDLMVVLSHANSAINPFLYAYHLKEFRLAMRNSLYALAKEVSCGRFAHVTPVPVTSQTNSGGL